MSAITHLLPPDNAPDLALLERTLELAAERHPDITPLVYARFFERCPQARTLFELIAPDQPPRGCGQMLFEILSLLVDCAAGRPHVAPYAHQVDHDHHAFGVDDPNLYAAFLDAVVDVLALQLGADWTTDLAAAWARQCRALLQHLH